MLTNDFFSNGWLNRFQMVLSKLIWPFKIRNVNWSVFTIFLFSFTYIWIKLSQLIIWNTNCLFDNRSKTSIVLNCTLSNLIWVDYFLWNGLRSNSAMYSVIYSKILGFLVISLHLTILYTKPQAVNHEPLFNFIQYHW